MLALSLPPPAEPARNLTWLSLFLLFVSQYHLPPRATLTCSYITVTCLHFCYHFNIIKYIYSIFCFKQPCLQHRHEISISNTFPPLIYWVCLVWTCLMHLTNYGCFLFLFFLCLWFNLDSLKLLNAFKVAHMACMRNHKPLSLSLSHCPSLQVCLAIHPLYYVLLDVLP